MVHRTIQLLAGSVQTLVGGSLYLFCVYALQLKDKMNMNQTQINDIGALMFIGGCILSYPVSCFTLISSFQVSYLADTSGPKVPMIIATIAGSECYLIVFLGVHGVFTLPYFVTFLCFAGIGFYYTAMFTIILPAAKFDIFLLTDILWIGKYCLATIL